MKKFINNKIIQVVVSFMVVLLVANGHVPSIAQKSLLPLDPVADYSLRVIFDEPSISPIPGSIISGRVTLLQNEESVKSIPTDLWSNDIREEFTPQLDIEVSGIKNVYYYRDEYKYGREVDQYRLTTTESALLKTQIFSPQATNQWNYPINGDKFLATLDFTSGDVQFGYVYGGGAIDSKITFNFTARFFNANISTSKVLPFGSGTDIIRSQDLNRQIKDSFYYDVSFDTTSVNKDRERHVKITVTAKDTLTKKVYDNAFQRIRMELQPIRVEYNPNARDSIDKTTFYYPGRFRGTDLFINTNTDWGKTAVFYSSYKLREYPQNVKPESDENDFANVIELDLVNGKGEVWFTYEGQQGFVPYVSFRVSPTDYYIKKGLGQFTSDGTSYRTKLEIPRRPPGSEMLYSIWREDDSLTERVFTIASLPIANPVTNYTPPSLGNPVEVILKDIEDTSMITDSLDEPIEPTPKSASNKLPLGTHNQQAIWWLIGFHISVVLISGALVFILRRRNKNYGKN